MFLVIAAAASAVACDSVERFEARKDCPVTTREACRQCCASDELTQWASQLRKHSLSGRRMTNAELLGFGEQMSGIVPETEWLRALASSATALSEELVVKGTPMPVVPKREAIYGFMSAEEKEELLEAYPAYEDRAALFIVSHLDHKSRSRFQRGWQEQSITGSVGLDGGVCKCPKIRVVNDY